MLTLCWILPIFHLLEANADGFPSGKPARFKTARVLSLYMHLRKALFYRDIFSANLLYAVGRSCIGPTTGSSMTVSSKGNWVDKGLSTHDSTHVFWLEESVSAQHFEFWLRDPNHERVPIQPRPGYAPKKKTTTHTSVSATCSNQQPQSPKALKPRSSIPRRRSKISPVQSTETAPRKNLRFFHRTSAETSPYSFILSLKASRARLWVLWAVQLLIVLFIYIQLNTFRDLH